MIWLSCHTVLHKVKYIQSNMQVKIVVYFMSGEKNKVKTATSFNRLLYNPIEIRKFAMTSQYDYD